MKKQIRFILYFGILLSGTVLLSAQENGGGFYVGTRLGASFLDTPKERDRPGPGLKEYKRTSLSGSIFGGHQWKIYCNFLAGVEAGYSNNGNATITYASDNEYMFKSTEIDILGVVTYEAGWGIFGSVKGGIGRTREQYGISKYISGTPDLKSEQSRDLFVGVFNLGYRCANGIGVALDIRRTFGDKSNTVTRALMSTNPNPPPYQDMLNTVAQVDVVSVCVVYQF